MRDEPRPTRNATKKRGRSRTQNNAASADVTCLDSRVITTNYTNPMSAHMGLAMHRLNRRINLNIIRHLTSESTKASTVTIDSVKKAPPNVFGTLSESGRNQLVRRIAEQEISEDLSGYDTLEIDYEPRKNHYYYKYEITKHARLGSVGLRRALELFHEMKAKARLEPTLENFAPLIYGCAKAGYTKRAFELYDEMLKFHGRPTNSVITCLMNSCAESPFPDYAIQRLDWFRKHLRVEFNRQLNEIQYNSAIKAYGKLGRLDEASRLVQEMIDNNVHPSIDTFNMLLIGCASNKESGCSLALRVYKRIKMYELKPNLVTYRLLLRCIRDCRMGSPELLAETFNELPAVTSLTQRLDYQSRMKRHNSKKSDRPNFAWVPLLEDMGKHIAEAVKVTQAASVVPVSPKTGHKSSPSSKSDNPSKILGQANDPNSDQLTNMTSNHEVMLPNLLSNDHLDLVMRIKSIQLDRLQLGRDRLLLFGGLHGYLGTMMEDGCKPDSKTFSLILECLQPTRENYLEYFKLAEELGIKKDLVFYDLLLKHICQEMLSAIALELALQFVEKMHLDHLRPNISTFEALASGCTDWRAANKLISDVEKCGFVVSEVMIANFFASAMRRARFDYLNELIRYCTKVRFTPNKLLVDKLESLRLKTHERILNQERYPGKVDKPISDRAISDYDNFRELLGAWLRVVELKEEDHPWSQFQVEHGSKNANFRQYVKQMSLANRAKQEALQKGEELGNLFEKSRAITSPSAD